MILTVVKYHTLRKQHLCVYTYTQCVLAELLPLRKEILCHVDKALKTAVQHLSSAKAAYKLSGITRKEMEGKKRKHHYAIV